jgi:hypothetical protein
LTHNTKEHLTKTELQLELEDLTSQELAIAHSLTSSLEKGDFTAGAANSMGG